MFLGRVIGRRSMTNTASSRWPCQKHYLGFYISVQSLLQKRILYIVKELKNFAPESAVQKGVFTEYSIFVYASRALFCNPLF
jgi:hypothetical protein